MSLSRKLQTENYDLREAMNLADIAKEVLEERRENATENFKEIYQCTAAICHKHNISITKPRITSCRTNRCNVNAANEEEYYHIAVYIPYLDLFITHLHDRFLKH